MCSSCTSETVFVRLSDDVVAEAEVSYFDYDSEAEYSEQELDENVRLDIKQIWMTRRNIAKHNKGVRI